MENMDEFFFLIKFLSLLKKENQFDDESERLYGVIKLEKIFYQIL